MDRLEAMSVLLAVVETGSLSAAGRRLAAPLSTVSRKVSDLEALLGARLLIRSSRRIALTEAGQSYVAACKRILADVEEAERAAAGEYSAPKGDLVITAPVVFGRLHLLPLVVEFLRDLSRHRYQAGSGGPGGSPARRPRRCRVADRRPAGQQPRRNQAWRNSPRRLRQPGLFRRTWRPGYAARPVGPYFHKLRRHGGVVQLEFRRRQIGAVGRRFGPGSRSTRPKPPSTRRLPASA